MALEPVVYFENVGTSDAFTNIAAEDRFNLNVSGDQIEFPSRASALGILYAGSASGSGDIEEARTDIPSLREPSDIYVGDVHDDVKPTTWPFPHLDLRGQGVSPSSLDQMKVEVRGADGGTAEDYLLAMMLEPANARSIPDGERRRIFFDGDSAPSTADAWNRIGISLDQTLINGNYEIIGASVRHADGVVFGFDFESQNFLSGGFCVTDEHQTVPPFQQPGALGRGWGQFRDENPPDLVIFGTGTTNDVEGHIDIVGPL